MPVSPRVLGQEDWDEEDLDPETFLQNLGMLGDLPQEVLAEAYEEMGDYEDADRVYSADSWPWGKDPWECTKHVFGLK